MLQLIDAQKRYTSGVCALQNVALTARPGDYLSVTGASGSGKSTLVHILGLLDTLTAGQYLLGGVEVARLSPQARARLRGAQIGFVFQQFRLLPGLTALENVALPLALQGVPRAERRHRAAAALASVGLTDRARHKPGQLSGGQQQRVAIARAVVTRPCVVLADEPTAGLDPAAAGDVLALLDALHRSGHTIVLITHDRQAAARAERRLYLENGVLSGDTEGRRRSL
ncbi:MAG: ABC transporter ATP-binding protein [Eubacteriales bacterium]|nr:ABC transporter ATP-binding protein [Eubacteriales bacterium]